MSDILDSAAQDAQVAEATETPSQVEFGGAVYTIPPVLDLPVEFLEAIQAGDELGVLLAVLGEEQYETFRAAKPTLRNLKEFSEKIIKAAGLGDLGN